MKYPTAANVERILEEVEELNLPDAAYWSVCQERLDTEFPNIPYDIFDLIDKYCSEMKNCSEPE